VHTKYTILLLKGKFPKGPASQCADETLLILDISFKFDVTFPSSVSFFQPTIASFILNRFYHRHTTTRNSTIGYSVVFRVIYYIRAFAYCEEQTISRAENQDPLLKAFGHGTLNRTLFVPLHHMLRIPQHHIPSPCGLALWSYFSLRAMCEAVG
jgi:hypothetical protein